VYKQNLSKKSFQKLLLSLLCFFAFLNISFAQESSQKFSTECGKDYSSLVFNLENGNIVFETEADKIIYPASLTKLMTLYLVFEALKEKKLNLKDNLFATERTASISKVNKINTLNLAAGDSISVDLAIKGLIVKSFNELSVMLAEKIAGDEWQFARDMNLKAKKLGMSSSNFRNSSGLHNQGQFSTSEDLAKLVLALKKDFPEYYHFFSLKEFTYKNIKYPTHNNILLKYKGADGMKTGFTNAAGFNLIASAHQNNKRIISILTGCESIKKRDNTTKQLLDLAFKNN
jgi:D-alanyl-D-alanine carboxypeptidase